MSSARRALLVLLGLFPAVVTAAAVRTWQVDLPLWDQWRFPALLERARLGELTLAELWSQHNEHRILVPRLVTIALALCSGWDVRLELATNFLLAALSLGLLVFGLGRVARDLRAPGVLWLAPGFATLAFSLTQWENWLWGMEMAIFLEVVFALASFVLLTGARLDGWRWLGAAIAGFLAAGSFASGLLVGPLGLALLLRLHPERRREIGGWIAVWIVVACAYLLHYRPAGHALPLTVLEKPLAHLAWCASMLGAPLASSDRTAALAAGATGVFAFGLLAAWAWRRPPAQVRSLAFFVAVGLHAIGCAAITTIGRFEVSGELASLTSRYVTFSTLLWQANLALLVSFAAERRSGLAGAGASPIAAALTTTLPIVVVGSVLALVGRSEIDGLAAFRRRHAELAPVRSELLTREPDEVPDEVLRRLWWSPEQVRAGLKVLRREGWSVYRNRSAQPEPSGEDPIRPGGPG